MNIYIVFYLLSALSCIKTVNMCFRMSLQDTLENKWLHLTFEATCSFLSFLLLLLQFKLSKQNVFHTFKSVKLFKWTRKQMFNIVILLTLVNVLRTSTFRNMPYVDAVSLVLELISRVLMHIISCTHVELISLVEDTKKRRTQFKARV